MEIHSRNFGVTGDGREVTAYTITNSTGAYITVLDFGAVLQAVGMPDRNGTIIDVALGYDDMPSYEKNPPHFGATIGRFGNRIEGGLFTLDGTEYQLVCNENNRNNSLHSGPNGYEFRLWDAEAREDSDSVTFYLVSPDGDQGFPGEFKVAVSYTLTEDNRVKIHYEGITDATTIVNMTNHSYFNLNGHDAGTILDHMLKISADGYVPIDEYAIPYGIVSPVEGTPFDFRQPKRIGEEIDADHEQIHHGDGYDHNFALNGEGMRDVVTAVGDQSGIRMTVSTDLPGVQFYAGNHIGGPAGKGGHTYGVREGFALETQYFPNCVNVLAVKSPKLDAGDSYSTTTCYTFDIV